MQTGTIIAFNPRRGMFAVRIDGGDCTVFELMGGYDLAAGQRVRGQLDSSLCQALRNLDTAEQLDVVVQALGCSAQEAWRLVAA